MKHLLMVWFLAITTAAFGQADTGQPPPASMDANEAITHLREGLVDSLQKADVDRLLSYLDPNVVVTWQNGEVCYGPEAVRVYYNRMMKGERRIVREVKNSPEILGRHVYGDSAVSWGNLHDTIYMMDGTVLPLNTVFTGTASRRGDRWLLVGFHASVSAFENPILSLAVHKTAYWVGGIGVGVGLLAGIGLAILFRRRRNSNARP